MLRSVRLHFYNTKLIITEYSTSYGGVACKLCKHELPNTFQLAKSTKMQVNIFQLNLIMCSANVVYSCSEVHCAKFCLTA